MAATNLHFSPYSLNFQHRNNEDGTCDSICLRCYRTVATSQQEAWLAHEESIHTCTLLDLHAWMSDRARARS
ncbi:MAG: hypothetical protein QOK38_3726 [Acidobacteriaceae bacterium]|jgi:hypothetical protein|nr:hypothetical protein [Acidobacteriaceae bacterium]